MGFTCFQILQLEAHRSEKSRVRSAINKKINFRLDKTFPQVRYTFHDTLSQVSSLFIQHIKNNVSPLNYQALHHHLVFYLHVTLPASPNPLPLYTPIPKSGA